jgi:hypothetical protein
LETTQRADNKRRMNLLRGAALGLLAVAACGPATPGPAEPTTLTPTATAVASAPPAVVEEPEAGADLAALPANPVIVGSLSGAVVDKGLSALKLIEPRIAAQADVLKQLHLDPSRPITFAMEGLSQEDEELVQKLAQIAPKHEIGSDKAPGMAASVERLLGAHKVHLHFRAILPSTNAVDALTELPKLLEANKLRVASKSAKRVVATIGRAALSFSATAGAIVVDVASRGGGDNIEPWRSTSLISREPAPALDGRAARYRLRPEKLGELGFLMGVELTMSAVAGDAVAPEQRDRLVSQGLFESNQNLLLAGSSRGAFFDAEELLVDANMTSIELRFEPGKGFAQIPDAAWLPSPSLAVTGGLAVLEHTTALRKAWTAPATGFDAWRMGKDGGFAGTFLALPFAVFATEPWSANVADRFERVTLALSPSRSEVHLGLLPAKTSRADAACAVAVVAKCAAGDKLVVGKTKSANGWHTRLVDVKGRLVVATSRDAAAVEKLTLELPASAPMRFDASASLVPGSFGVKSLGGELSHDGATIVLRLKPQ